MKIVLMFALGLIVLICLVGVFATQRPVEASRVIWPVVENLALEDFVGVTFNGQVERDLFPITPSGVPTEPVVVAAHALLEALTGEQKRKVSFPVTDDEWRRWANIHISTRQGVGFVEMTAVQQAAVWSLLEAGLSVKGLKLARDITRLEEHLAELKDDHNQYGEHRYWITVMGQPSTTEPWGWQFEGHHLVINYFVMGDQVVMTPTFMGSEPVAAKTGKYAGTTVLQAEQALGLALVRALTPDQRNRAVISKDKLGNNNYGELFQDNAQVPLQGLALGELSGEPLALARQLIQTYVGNMRDAHAAVRMQEITTHWDQTRFVWVGSTDADAVFYYRIQSPVVMIEFDHQLPIALTSDGPSRQHIHTVVRTPNGNDYGQDLLRQHLAAHAH